MYKIVNININLITEPVTLKGLKINLIGVG